MIDHKIAQKLKEAGFATLFGFPIANASDGLYHPSLSELIEACGDNFVSLVNNKLSGLTTEDGYRAFGTGFKSADGDIPEDAVANLWLKLNKK